MQDDAKPVAWMYENEEGSKELILNCNSEYAQRLLEFGYVETPLYALPPAPAQPADVERMKQAISHAEIDNPQRSLSYYLGVGIDALGHDFDRHDALITAAARAALAAMPVGDVTPLRRAFSLLLAICENEPDEPIADNGMTVLDAVRQDARKLIAETVVPITPPADAKTFALGDRVTKTKGSRWTGRVVGFYSTSLTPVGYAVESENEPGSVQIYPESALTPSARITDDKDRENPVEGVHPADADAELVEPTPAMINRGVDFAIKAKLSGEYTWPDYVADLYREMNKAALGQGGVR